MTFTIGFLTWIIGPDVGLTDLITRSAGEMCRDIGL